MKMLISITIFVLFLTLFKVQAATPEILASSVVKCDYCSQTDIRTHARTMYLHAPIGEYNMAYLDLGRGVYSKVTVSVTSASFGGGDGWGGNSEQTTLDIIVNSNDQTANQRLKDIKNEYNGITSILNAGYHLDDSFAFRSVYEALLSKNSFMSEIEHFVHSDNRISTKINNAKAIAEVLAGNLSISASAVVAGVAIGAINNTYVTVGFSDGTKIEVKISIKLVNGNVALDVTGLGQAYDKNDELVPSSFYQLRDKSFSGAYGDAFFRYIESLGTTVTISGGSGGDSTTCSTEMDCDSEGQKCVVTYSCN